MPELDKLIERMPKLIRNSFMEALEIAKQKGYFSNNKGMGLTEDLAKVIIYGEFIGELFPKDYLRCARN
ncbi:MAG: hypothetical protein NTU63_03720 [Candidatus Pacearchaeota archaeon]|nr:hypothetical protein [Candidatus Pacearchaeota archaeon]